MTNALAEPGSLTNHFFLDELIVYHAQSVDSGEQLRVTTAPDQWAYAIGLPRLGGPVSAPGGFKIVINAFVEEGIVGIGALRWSQQEFITESLRGEGRTTFELKVADLDEVESLILRNARSGNRASTISIDSIEVLALPEAAPAASLKEVTTRPFTRRALRNDSFHAAFATSEKCPTACRNCRSIGPKDAARSGSLDPALVEKAMMELRPNSQFGFTSTGDFFSDPHWRTHLTRAQELGHKPVVLTDGQSLTPENVDFLLAAGVRVIELYVESICHDEYRRISGGRELKTVLDALEYINRKKESQRDLKVIVNCTSRETVIGKEEAIIDFWRGKADQVNFNAEYENVFDFKNIPFIPEERIDCEIQTKLLPSGHIAPCCAIIAYAHNNDVSWLPHASENTLAEAYDKLCDLYDDPSSPLGQICQNCDWWITFLHMDGKAPYRQVVALSNEQSVTVSSGACNAACN